MMNGNIKKITTISKSLKLLYVEDDETTRVSTLEMLKNFFTDISIAVDGRDGLDTFAQGAFDLVISDINMPRLNGIEMLREIRKTEADIPVLIFSAHNETDYFLETIKLGVDGYILKPLESAQFITALAKVVEKIYLKKQSAQYQLRLEQEVQERTKELQKKLHYDDLTGLLNRYSFFEDI
jgi:YesN/AraC family two-component response regulator